MGTELEFYLTGPLFMDHLLLQESIKINQFSILMTYDHEQSSLITFGGIPSFITAIENRDAFEKSVSHRVAGDDHWMLKMNDIRVGDKTILPSVNFALTDTGTSLIHLDTIDFQYLIKTICEQ